MRPIDSARLNLLKPLVFTLIVGGLFLFGMRLLSRPSTLDFWAGLAILTGLVATAIPTIIMWFCNRIRELESFMGVVLIVLFMASGCASITPGNAGIKVHSYGGSKGVDVEPLGVGVWTFNPFTESIIEYPVYVQTTVWTKDPNEGKATNEELSFNTHEGMLIHADISLSYHLEASFAPAFYSKFRTSDLNIFTHGFLHNCARDAFNDLAPQYTVEQVYGDKKEELRKKVQDRVQTEVTQFGIVIEQFGYLNGLRLPEAVVAALNGKIQATQDAMRVENEVAKATAEAKKIVATAEGAAQARMLQAKAEADANHIIAESITPELVQYQLALRWDGKRPLVEGTSSTLLSGLSLPTETYTAPLNTGPHMTGIDLPTGALGTIRTK